jgi:putative transcriptional regulator
MGHVAGISPDIAWPPANPGDSLGWIMSQSLAGQLLLASPSLLDPNFVRTVVLIGIHSEDGAMGVVLNRPSTVTVQDAVPQLEDVVGALDPVYVGGPVQQSSVVFLAEFLEPSLAGTLVLGRIGFPAPDAGVQQLSEGTSRSRVFAGHAGWGAGQLDAEIEGGDWITHPAQPQDVFTDVPDELWSSVLTRMGGSYALIARMPLDPSVN